MDRGRRRGRWRICSSCWCNWGSVVERLQCAAVQHGGLNQRVSVHPGSCADAEQEMVVMGKDLGVRDDGRSRGGAAETDGEIAGGQAAT